jgi:hypothetical protein
MKPPTFKYGLTVPAAGSHKLKRFAAWIAGAAPDIAYRLPPQAPIETASLTIRLRSDDDRQRLQSLLPATLP